MVNSLTAVVKQNDVYYRIEMATPDKYRVLTQDERGQWDVEVEILPQSLKRTIEWMAHAFRNMS